MSDSVIRLWDFYYAYPQSDVLLKDINLSVRKKVPLRPSQDSGAWQDDSLPGHDGIVPTYYGGPLCQGRYAVL